MTIPQFDDTPTENLGGGEKRDPSEFVPWDRIAEVDTPRGKRPGLVIIVRPLERIKDYRDKDPENDWKTLVIADIAILDPIPPGFDQYQMPLPPVPAGSQWRNQLVFPGMLNKAWRDKIGGTLIGVVYLGQPKPMPNGTLGKPPFLWRSLSQDEQQVRRGQGFMAARPEFLVPIPRVAPHQQAQQDQWASPQQTYATTQADPWAQPLGQQPQYQPQPDQYYQQHSVHPVQAPPQYQQNPAQYAQGPPPGYQQPDPWAQQPPGQVAPAQQPPQQHPHQGMSTLEQMKAQAAAVNAQGQPQTQDPPF